MDLSISLMRAIMEGSQWDIVLLKLSKLYSDRLSKLSHRDLVKFCLENPTRYVAEHFLNNVKKSSSKDSDFALKKKEEGNEKYKKAEFEESLSLYTEGVFHAAKNDECLPLLYSNRALVLERLGHLSESLVDIDMALSCGYPRQKLENLTLRKARCLLQLGDVEKSREILTEALENTEKEEYHIVFENELQKMKDKKCKKSSNSEFKIPDLVGGENKDFIFASKHLSVHYDKIRGRHVIANRDIELGDVLFVEKPFAFVAFGKLCFNCFKDLIAPIPCWTCTSAYYCSPKCRDNSWNAFHSFECGFAELFKSIGIAHLALRIILKVSHSLNELKELLKNISEPKYENGSIISISAGYETVYNLVHNFEYYEASDMFQYVMTALLLALYLKNHTKYFPIESDDEDLNFLTSVILRHILQLICNGFCISELSRKYIKETDIDKSVEVKSGSAIYTSSSMMNHSCVPSVFKSFYRNYIIIRALKAIKKGEEVFNSYGPEAAVMKKAKRQEILRNQYFFNCKCEQCLQKFDIQDKFTAFKCVKCKGPSVPIEEYSQDTVCLDCGINSKISLDVAKKYNKFYTLMSEGKVYWNEGKIDTLTLRKYLQAWRIGREIFYKFHVDVLFAAQEVAMSLVHLREWKKCISFLKCCIRSMEERYGVVEYGLAHEMKKLADIISVYVINNEKSKDAKDLACEGLVYYRKVQNIISTFPEYNNDFKDLDLNIKLLEMLLKKL